MKDLYIISSPFQLISALSAMKSSKYESYLVVLKTVNEKGNHQIELILDKFNIQADYICFLKQNVFYRYKQISKMVTMLNLLKIKHLFIGDYRQFESALLECNIVSQTSFLLDDGGATNTLQKIFNRNGNIIKENQNKIWLKKIFVYLTGLKFPQGEIKNFYTIYDLKALPGQKIMKNNIQNITSLVTTAKPKKTLSNVYFIGSSLVENGIINCDIYFNYLKKITAFLSNENQMLIYLPHRIETEKKLNKIKDLGFKIEPTNFPVEIEFLVKGIQPQKIASFFSTALFTLSKIFPQATIFSFKIEENDINPSNREHIASLYESTSTIANIIELK